MTLIGERADDNEVLALRLGEIQVRRTIVEQDDKGREYTRRDILVGDESGENPSMRRIFWEEGNQFEQALLSNEAWTTVVDDGEVHISKGNKAAEWLYYDQAGKPTQMLEWAQKFPTAIALEPLQRLQKGGKWLKGGGLDKRSLEYFTYMVDGIGLRARARVYRELLVDAAEGRDDLQILSIGSGAAVPNIEATERLEGLQKAIHWNFYDINPEALGFAKQLIGDSQFEYSSFDYGPEKLNPDTGVLEPTGRNFFRAFGEVANESVDVVDALGLWEYLPHDTAVKFLQGLYVKLKPGGSMIVSNMLPDRPQKQFNLRAVGWPGLYLRGDTDLLDIVDTAGLDTKDATITHTNDGVYAVMEIKK